MLSGYKELRREWEGGGGIIFTFSFFVSNACLVINNGEGKITYAVLVTKQPNFYNTLLEWCCLPQRGSSRHLPKEFELWNCLKPVSKAASQKWNWRKVWPDELLMERLVKAGTIVGILLDDRAVFRWVIGKLVDNESDPYVPMCSNNATLIRGLLWKDNLSKWGLVIQRIP